MVMVTLELPTYVLDVVTKKRYSNKGGDVICELKKR